MRLHDGVTYHLIESLIDSNEKPLLPLALKLGTIHNIICIWKGF